MSAWQGEDWEGGGVGHMVFLVSCNVPLYDPVSQARLPLAACLPGHSGRLASSFPSWHCLPVPTTPSAGPDPTQKCIPAASVPGAEAGWAGRWPAQGGFSQLRFVLSWCWVAALNQRMKAVGLHCAWWSEERSQAPAVAPGCLARSPSLAPDNGQALPPAARGTQQECAFCISALYHRPSVTWKWAN